MKSQNLTIQMKASDQCFPGCRLILFTTSCWWLLSLFFSLRHGWNSSEVWLFKWKPLSSTFPGLVLGSLYLTSWSGLTFQCMDKILRRYHLNESLWAVLSWGAVLYVVKVICSSFPVCGSEILKCDHPNQCRKFLRSTFLWCCSLCPMRWSVLPFQSMEEWNPKV